MGKTWIAFLLGVGSFLVGMFVGESAGLDAMAVVLLLYFFACQLLLSRGHADALSKDWRIMLALDSIPVVVVLIMIAVEKQEVILSQGPRFLLPTLAGTVAGAIVASRTAKRAAAQPLKS